MKITIGIGTRHAEAVQLVVPDRDDQIARGGSVPRAARGEPRTVVISRRLLRPSSREKPRPVYAETLSGMATADHGLGPRPSLSTPIGSVESTSHERDLPNSV